MSDIPTPLPSRGSRTARVTGMAVAAVCAVGLAAGTGLYLARTRIGVELATNYFASHGVPARIVIRRLDFDGFVGSLSLGPEKAPDLVVDRLEVDFVPQPLLRRAQVPTVRAVRLTGARLKGRYAGGKLSFGSLQPLIDDILSRPATGPLPDVLIRAGRLDLATPVGALRLTGDAELPKGRVAGARLHVAPTRLAANGLLGEGLGGDVDLIGRGERLDARFSLAAATASAPAAKLTAVRLTGSGQLPYPQTGRPPEGRVSLDANLAAQRLAAAAGTAEVLAANLKFDGGLAAPTGALTLAGSGRLSAGAASARQPGVNLTAAKVDLASERFTFSLIDGRWRAAGVVGGSAAAAGGQVLAAGRPLQLRSPNLAAKGEITAGPQGVALTLSGEARTGAGFGAADANALTASLAGAPALRASASAALRDVRLEAAAFALDAEGSNLRLSLRRPLLARRGSGLSLAVSPRQGAPVVAIDGGAATGAFDLATTGGGLPEAKLQVASYRAGRGTLDAAGRLEAAGGFAPVRDASLALDYRLTQGGGRLAVAAPGCGTVKAAAVDGEGGAALATDIAFQLCPAADGAPLLVADRAGWRAAGRLAEASAAIPQAGVRVEQTEATVFASSAAPTARVSLAKLRLIDTAAARRFEPLGASGEAALDGGVLKGRFKVALAAGAPLAEIDLTHDTATGAGGAEVRTDGLVFGPALQPAAITPLAGDLVSDLKGAVSASATFAWGPGEAPLKSRGKVSAAGLDARTPFGRITGLAGDVELSSLAPLVVPAGQEIRAASLDALVPVTDLKAKIGFGPEGLAVSDASVAVAKGRASLDPLVLPLDPSKPIEATLRIKSLDLADLLAAFNLSEAVSVQARVDGTLPFVVNGTSVKISGGKIFADGPGRLSIRREALQGAVGGGEAVAKVEGQTGAATALPAAPVQQNAVQDFAYQALENLAFESLDATVDSRPQGRLGMVFHLKGRHDPPTSVPTTVAVTDLVRGTAFDKPIALPKGTPVDLTLDTSLNFDQLLADYSGLSRRRGSAQVQP